MEGAVFRPPAGFDRQAAAAGTLAAGGLFRIERRAVGADRETGQVQPVVNIPPAVRCVADDRFAEVGRLTDQAGTALRIAHENVSPP